MHMVGTIIDVQEVEREQSFLSILGCGALFSSTESVALLFTDTCGPLEVIQHLAKPARLRLAGLLHPGNTSVGQCMEQVSSGVFQGHALILQTAATDPSNHPPLKNNRHRQPL